jgi:mRNA interferase MazF
MYIKKYDAWNEVKKRIEEETRKVYIRAGEVRWVSLGVNVGSEIDGKGVSFMRPALVLHVMGSHLALVVPMSTKTDSRPGYVSFLWKEKSVSLCVHQTRVISQKRIFTRQGKISPKRLIDVKKQITTFFNFDV